MFNSWIFFIKNDTRLLLGNSRENQIIRIEMESRFQVFLLFLI